MAILFFGFVACGTIIKNGKGGKTYNLDVSIVLLNAIGVLFFIVPA